MIKVIIVLITFAAAAVYGQTLTPIYQQTGVLPGREARKRGGMDSIELPSDRELLSLNLSKAARKFVEPDRSIRQKYSAFLKKGDASIIKLFDSTCEGIGQIAVLSMSCTTGIPGFGSYYSFRERRYFQPKLADVRLHDGSLQTDGFLVEGLIVPLGDVPVEGLSLASKGLSYLGTFVPSASLAEAESQSRQLQDGLVAGDYTYYRNVKLQPSFSYGIRLIAYRSGVKTLSVDPRVDMIAVFKIVGIDKDGTVTLVWRQLERREAPKLR